MTRTISPAGRAARDGVVVLALLVGIPGELLGRAWPDRMISEQDR